MRLSRSMIEIFAGVIRGKDTIESLSKAMNKSANRITEIIQELENESFVVKKRAYKIKGSRIIIEPANTTHAIKLKELIFQYPTIKFEDILSDSKLLFLTAISEDWANTKTAASLSRVSRYMVDKYRPALKNKGIIMQKSKLYKINEKAWPTLREFLISYKNYSNIKGLIKWKYQEELLFEVDNKELINGSITGFAKYHDYGIKVNFISVLCKIPEKKLSKEEIFVHSLFEVNDPRTLALALTFYLRNKLNYKKLLPIAMKYGKYTMLESMASLLKSKENKIRINGLPEFNRTEFRRIAKIYRVKNV